ncbi:chorismate mutase [Enterovirga rhinocerotis]|uniref:chorismate mutase n=1 Tax=Enterovirga rhinocerotis TaxID=1339210 RepID=A0A4R7C8C6_9HYPH|nr:chorismate mutase [Enterovirga rhinocerotis]TDR93555.1 chorismate mutase [Enterovirga rhinocerotis]
MAGLDQEAALGELRRDIDRIDASMHQLLMERGRIIDRLIAVKGGTTSTGSAFRPEREASMMRILAERHGGGLPFDAVEGIWRIIISTFTHLQAPFAVHADVSGDATAIRDSARFHFGFLVPLSTHHGPDAVIDAVASSRGDLGLVPISGVSVKPWWQRLEEENAPKAIAHLPFVDRPNHPAAHPVLVIATSFSGEGLSSVALYSVRGLANDSSALAELGGTVLSRQADNGLVALPRDIAPSEVASRLGAASARIIGSHPATTPAGS